jgi:hypothetical protein
VISCVAVGGLSREPTSAYFVMGSLTSASVASRAGAVSQKSD